MKKFITGGNQFFYKNFTSNYGIQFNFMGINTEGRRRKKGELRIHPVLDY